MKSAVRDLTELDVHQFEMSHSAYQQRKLASSRVLSSETSGVDPSDRETDDSVASADRPQSGSMQSRTYDALRGMIEAGKVKPGENLFEADLARAFNIGRSPARLALAALCRDGFIVENAGRGYRVPGPAGEAPPETSKIASFDAIDVSAPPQWQSLHEEIERALAMQILYASIRVTEEGIAAHFHVSRTVVRGVMARLHSAGLLSKNTGGHWVAKQVTADRIAHLLEMRRLLEPTALLAAAEYAPKTVVQELRDRLAGWSAGNRRGGSELYDAEKDLHIDLLSYCPNGEIGIALARTHVLFEPTRWLSNSAVGTSGQPLQEALAEHLHVEDALTEHLKILDMILSGQVEGASEVLRQHIVQAEQRWTERFEIVRRIKQPDYPPYLAPA